MGLVQCFVIALILSAHLVLTSPVSKSTIDDKHYYTTGCPLCPAGEYQKSCKECRPCTEGWYTTEWNREEGCHLCYGDCRPEFHLKVIQNCTRTSNVKCICQDGFRCTDEDPMSKNCRYCAKIQQDTTTEATPSSASTGHSRSSVGPCKFPKCDPPTVPSGGNGTHFKTDHTRSQLAAILCPIVAIGLLALVIMFIARRPADESCFKGAIAKLRNEGGKDATHKPKVSAHQFPADSFSAKQQPSPLSAANLGPVHVHNPGTVIFSLLSQFTGQVGSTIEAGKTHERGSSEEEDERDCHVFHPTSSTSIHLSEEERSGEIDSIFFPSQEQGKDCHVSKEEVL